MFLSFNEQVAVITAQPQEFLRFMMLRENMQQLLSITFS